MGVLHSYVGFRSLMCLRSLILGDVLGCDGSDVTLFYFLPDIRRILTNLSTCIVTCPIASDRDFLDAKKQNDLVPAICKLNTHVNHAFNQHTYEALNTTSS